MVDILPRSDLDEPQYPGLKVVIPTTISVVLAVFVTSLDRTIIGVAVPAISNDFNSFNDISWYEAAYLLTNAAFQLPMGKVYTFFSTKWTFIATIVIFEIGSIICAAAPTSTAFIVGRAIAGFGSAGTGTGAIIIFVDLLPLQKRPKYQGFIGASFGLASVAGPLLGGFFTSNVTWRWCFWINVPIGGLAIVVLLLILPSSPPPKKHLGESFKQRAKQFDPVGTAFLLPGLVLLLLGLQWGSNEYAWESTRVIVSLVLGPVLLIAFAVCQLWARDNGTIPPRIIGQRSVAAATAVSFGFGSALIILTFYLPIWYQAIKGLSAAGSGIRLLPYFLATVLFVIGSGVLVSKIGYYTPVTNVGMALVVISCGLFTTFRPDTSTAESIGFQIIASAGLGLTLIQSNNAVQTVLSREDIPVGVTIVNFAQLAGGTIFISVCQAILTQTLKTQLSTKIPGLDVQKLSSTGATDLTKLVPEELLPILLTAYNKAIVNVFYCVLGVACVGLVASFFLEWRTVKQQVEVAEDEVKEKV